MTIHSVTLETDSDASNSDLDQPLLLSRRCTAVLLGSILIVAMCGIVYELIIATVSSYLMGNSVYQFSITIGLFMSAMGIGSYLSRSLHRFLLDVFILVETVLALVGGMASVVLFLIFPISSFYQPVMYALILIIGTLVGLELPIIVRLLSHQGGLRKGVSDSLSLDYIGSLIGAVAFPLFLLPYLGLFRSSFAIGLLNAAIAIINAIVFRKIIRRPRLMLVGACLGAAVLLGIIMVASSITRYAESALYADRIVYRKQTVYQRIIVTRDETNGEHRLYLDGHIQFAEYDEYRYHEALILPVMSVPGPRESVLIVGGGDGLAAREILNFDTVKRVVLVDLDPQVVQFCRTFPPFKTLNQGSLDDARLQVKNADAFTFVQKDDQSYDRIIIDLPDPHNESLSRLYSVEFYRQIRNRMNPKAALVTQSCSPYYTTEAFWAIRDTLEASGFEVISYQVMIPSFGPWGFHLASVDSIANEFVFRDNTRFMTSAVMEAALVFAPDQQQVETRVNTIFRPMLYHWYLAGVRRGRPQFQQQTHSDKTLSSDG